MAHIENHHNEFIVVTLEAVNNNRTATNHFYSIVIHDDNNRGRFDFEELINSLHTTNLVEMADDFSQLFGNWVKKVVMHMTTQMRPF